MLLLFHHLKTEIQAWIRTHIVTFPYNASQSFYTPSLSGICSNRHVINSDHLPHPCWKRTNPTAWHTYHYMGALFILTLHDPLGQTDWRGTCEHQRSSFTTDLLLDLRLGFDCALFCVVLKGNLHLTVKSSEASSRLHPSSQLVRPASSSTVKTSIPTAWLC